MRQMLGGKIHRATVTEANVDYEGSITIDPDLMEAAGLLPYELVHVLDITNGARLMTYTIEGARGAREICINGAAARLVNPGDLVIILNYLMLTEEEARQVKPKVVLVDRDNNIVKKMDKIEAYTSFEALWGGNISTSLRSPL
jgi:aspartate 1-decarboxylase